jgi:hypothetical protein
MDWSSGYRGFVVTDAQKQHQTTLRARGDTCQKAVARDACELRFRVFRDRGPACEDWPLAVMDTDERRRTPGSRGPTVLMRTIHSISAIIRHACDMHGWCFDKVVKKLMSISESYDNILRKSQKTMKTREARHATFE